MEDKISVIVCTYNGGKLLKKCVKSIINQNYSNYEVLFLEGGSSDGTKEYVNEITKKDKRFRVIINKNKLPEGKCMGKWLGFKKSKGKIIGIIDQDNILQRNDLFKKVAEIIKKEKSILAVSGGLKNKKSGKHIERYVSLVGTDSFLAYRSLDFLRRLKDKNEEIEYYPIYKENMALVGSNCLFYSKSSLDLIGGYDRDVMVNDRLIIKKKNLVAVVNNATIHYSDKGLYKLAIKKFMWGKNYFKDNKNEGRYNYLPKTKQELRKFIRNITWNLFLFPNIYYSYKIYKNSKDGIAFIFPPMAFLNTIAYGITFIINKIRTI